MSDAALRAEIAEINEALELGGMTAYEERATKARLAQLQARLGDDAPPLAPIKPIGEIEAPAPLSHAIPELRPLSAGPPPEEDCMPLPDDRDVLWRELAALNTQERSIEISDALRRDIGRMRDRVWRKLERAA